MKELTRRAVLTGAAAATVAAFPRAAFAQAAKVPRVAILSNGLADDRKRSSRFDLEVEPVSGSIVERSRPVVDEQECLLRVGGEADVPDRSAAERVLRDHDLTNEAAVFREHLQAVVRSIAHVDEPVV